LVEASWQEQRDYLTNAISKLRGSHHREAEAEFAAIAAAPEPFTGDPAAVGEDIAAGRFRLIVSQSGSLTALMDEQSGRVWNGACDVIRLWREGFGAADYERFWKAYNVNTDRPDVAWWAEYDYQKPGLRETRADHCFWDFQLADLHVKRAADGVRLRVVLRSTDDAIAAGAPKRAELRYRFDDRRPGFDLDVFWMEKPATRLPEATWLSFAPAVRDPERWHFDKLGQAISPTDVVRCGGTTLHAVWHGATYDGPDGRIDFETLDAALIAPGRPRLLDYQEIADSAEGGLHVNLHNNVWGTNFPAWYEDDARFRFRVTLDPNR
jgi:hypothetical protein